MASPGCERQQPCLARSRCAAALAACRLLPALAPSAPFQFLSSLEARDRAGAGEATAGWAVAGFEPGHQAQIQVFPNPCPPFLRPRSLPFSSCTFTIHCEFT